MEARLRGSFAKQGLMTLFGATMTSIAPGRVEIALTPKPELSQQHGFVHGGVLSYVADNALTYAGGTAMRVPVVTSEFKINYLRPWQSGTLSCESRVIFKGRGTAVLQSDLHDGAGRHLAQASGTFAIITRSVG